MVLPDNDFKPGEGHKDAVAAILTRLTPTPTAKVVRLAGLPDGGDIVDWLDERDAHDSDELKAEIERMADVPEVIQPDRPAPAMAVWRPFPVDAMSEAMRRFAAKAIVCDPSFVAMPFLTASAAAIGNLRRLRLKHNWLVPPILWMVVVGDSGTSKTPAFKLVMQAIREQQRRAMDQYVEAMADYEDDLAATKRRNRYGSRTRLHWTTLLGAR